MVNGLKRIILRLAYSLFYFLQLPYPTGNKKSVQSLFPVAADFQPANFDTQYFHRALWQTRSPADFRSQQVPFRSRVERYSLHRSEIYRYSYSILQTSNVLYILIKSEKGLRVSV